MSSRVSRLKSYKVGRISSIAVPAFRSHSRTFWTRASRVSNFLSEVIPINSKPSFNNSSFLRKISSSSRCFAANRS